MRNLFRFRKRQERLRMRRKKRRAVLAKRDREFVSRRFRGKKSSSKFVRSVGVSKKK